MILSLVIGHLRQLRLMWPLPVLGAVGVALSPTFGAFGVTVVLPMVLGTMLPPAPTLFETALPLHARDVRIARAASALLIILLPCAAWLVAIQAVAYAWMPLLQIIRAGALLALLLMVAIALEASRDFRPGQHPMLALASGSALGVIAAIVALFDWRGLLLSRHVWLLGAAWDRVLLQLAPLLPRSIPVVLCMALLPAVVLYVLLERQHRRSELTTVDFHQPA